MAVTLPSMPRARDLRAALPTSPSVPTRERLLSLDVFRGITVAGMLLVNGSIANSILTTVNNGGTLGGTGTVGATIIANGGSFVIMPIGMQFS